LLLTALPINALAAADIHFKGDYFLFSENNDYIYGSGNIVLKGKDALIRGDVLYFDIQSLRGVLYGNVQAKTGTEEKSCHALFFTAFPLQLLYESFSGKIAKEGNKDLTDIIKKYAPEELKKSDLHFEFREFHIDKYKRIKAKTIIPYIMGLPTVPIRSFVIRRGETPDKTTIFFKNLNYSDLEGLSLSFILRLKKKFVKGDFDLKLFEKELLGSDNPKRGVLFSGNSDFLIKGSSFLNFSALLNSGDQSYNFGFNHRKDLKYFGYSLSQTLSGRGETPTYFQFASSLTLKKLKIINPTFNFSHNLKQSYSYGISTPLKVWKKLDLNIRGSRKILKESFESDTLDFSTSMNFTTSMLNLSSNYNFSKNLLDAAARKNFSVNMRFNPLHFLNKNVSLNFSSFYMFSAIPTSEETMRRSTPGINASVSSAGALLPFGIKLTPSFTFNHIWDDREVDFTDFNSQLALGKKIGKFNWSLAYALASRYRAKNFWVEGNNTQNLNMNLEFLDPKKYTFSLRFYYNNNLNLENISFSGKVNLPFDFVFSSFALYYNEGKKLQTLEIFLEKKILRSAKIQGGYSLALKKFFVQVISF
jgi:hypothetical protein